MTVVTVDLPFVPVTQMTRERSASSSHIPTPPSTGTPRVLEVHHVGSVVRDARGLDDRVAAAQRRGATLGRGQDPGDARRRGVIVDEDDLAAERDEAGHRRTPLDADAEDADAPTGEVAKGDRVPHPAPQSS